MVDYGKIKEVTEDMGMLKTISLENYKCFKERTDIDIAPLTVLCGVNSSGKSSILKSLLMLKQSYENNYSKGELLFSGKDVDNGTFKDITFNGTEKTFTLKTSFVIDETIIDQDKKEEYHADFSCFRDLNKIYEQFNSDNVNIYFKISISIKVSGNINPKSPFQAIRNSILNYKISIQMCRKDSDICIYKSAIFIKKGYNKKYTIKFENFPLIKEENNLFCINEEIKECFCYFNGIKIVKIYSDKPSINHDMNNFLPNVYMIFDIISTQFFNIKHMSPLREDPSRRYVITHGITESRPDGEDFAQILAQYGTQSKDFTFIKDSNDSECTFYNETTTLSEAVQIWSSYLNMGKLYLEHNEEILKVNVSGHNLIDVGFGVSQSLPILVAGLQAPKESNIIFEQPEIHLHPQAQMGMADFLLSLSLSKKNVIVETHSDHIINRLVKRIMLNKTGQLNKDICIYFVDKTCKNPVEKIEISPTKGIVAAPMNFFTQFASESMDIAKIGFTNHKEGVSWICNE